jgi:putative PIN family toxin of toxin-antitoxin system
MIRVVIDTNVFVSSFFGGNPKKIIDLWKNEEIVLCLSKYILDEYIDVLQRVGLRDENEIEELLSLFAKGFNILLRQIHRR